MKRLVRVIGWIFLSFGLIAIAIVLFFSYRQMRSQSQWVHRDATAILEVKSDRIFRELLGNAIWNPNAYLSSDRDTVADTTLQKLRPWNLGVALPANMYFFSLPTGSSAYFSVLPVDDLPRLQEVITAVLQTTIVRDQATFWSAQTDNKSVYVLGNEQYVVFAYNPKKSDAIIEPMQKLLSMPSDLVEVATMTSTKPDAAKGDLIHWNLGKDEFWSIDFAGGNVAINGLLSDPEWKFSKNPVGSTFPEDNILSIRLHADIRSWLAKHEEMLQQQGLPWQDIEPYLGNYWEVQWKNETLLQADTVITYDYDDNFEMVEQRTLRNESVPDLTIAFMASPHLLSYLPEKMFYKFYKHQVGPLLLLSTNSETPTQTETLNPQKEHFMMQYKRPEIWNTPFPFPGWFETIERADLTAILDKETALKLSGKVHFINKKLHPIKQLLDHVR